MTAEPFVLAIDDAVLGDLNQRIGQTRWAHEFSNEDWRYGANGAYLRDLSSYWRNDYDWRATERAINDWPNFRTTFDGIPIHFIHARGKGPSPIPLILNHGWPWTFWDYRKLIGPLTDPVAYGGRAEDAFDIVLPSLPGHGFSTPLTTPGVQFGRTADLWVRLMNMLGYDRFATQGGDWGAIISAALGHAHADRLIGLHVHLLLPLDLFGGGHVPDEDFGPNEQGDLANNRAFHAEEAGYMSIQSTRPQTPAFALEDSPVGLLAWLIEKRRRWSDCGGDVERRFSKNDLCDSATIYWVTQSFGTSARFYYEAAHNLWEPRHDHMPVVSAPTAYAAFPGEVLRNPRRWAERYFNIRRWTEMPSGGHFAPMEEPQALIDDIRAFFRDYR